ncbi:hypothetical protein BU25DRAFT_472781 [Macroventuria anomochaeta]|uniref:Uncharacterized protein n=1 Tax=Macroventuria anomochaeta TaxID=301207 RepID=A0ACB6RXV6_9PLEO|nr:uncharacterized protein BU25DRAFT_472781 [Macroventuria anomochaeta]KAF2625979.1 hypothetical protein BU25DRAFT_472781 [Macroventuria anomochaeta]
MASRSKWTRHSTVDEALNCRRGIQLWTRHSTVDEAFNCGRDIQLWTRHSTVDETFKKSTVSNRRFDPNNPNRITDPFQDTVGINEYLEDLNVGNAPDNPFLPYPGSPEIERTSLSPKVPNDAEEQPQGSGSVGLLLRQRDSWGYGAHAPTSLAGGAGHPSSFPLNQPYVRLDDYTPTQPILSYPGTSPQYGQSINMPPGVPRRRSDNMSVESPISHHSHGSRDNSASSVVDQEQQSDTGLVSSFTSRAERLAYDMPVMSVIEEANGR